MEKDKGINYFLIAWIIFITALYLSNFSYGASGDDSPGYIFSAYKIKETGSSIYQDEIAKVFIDNELKPEVAKPHWYYDLLNEKGFMAPMFPIGYPIIMATFSQIFGEVGYYLVNPIISIIFLISFYCLLREIALFGKLANLFALVTVIFISINESFWLFTIYQPMRDNTPFLFMSLALLVFYHAIKSDKLVLYGLGGLFLGYAVNIRFETIILVIPLASLYLYSKKEHFSTKKSFFVSVFFAIFLLVSTSMSIIEIKNTNMLSYHSKYKSVDSLTNGGSTNSNQLDKILPSGLSLNNLFNNQGKYMAGEGSFIVYLNIILFEIFGYYFIPFLIVGSIFLFINSRSAFLLFSLWALVIFLFYSMWVNPYYRYIILAAPPLAVLYTSSFIGLFKYVKNEKTKIVALLILLIFTMINYTPSLLVMEDYLEGKRPIPSPKSVTYQDFEKVSSFDLQPHYDVIITAGSTGDMIGFLEAHTGVKFIYLGGVENPFDYIQTLIENGYRVGLWSNLYDKKERDFQIFIESRYNTQHMSSIKFKTLGAVEIYSIYQRS